MQVTVINIANMHANYNSIRKTYLRELHLFYIEKCIGPIVLGQTKIRLLKANPSCRFLVTV